MAIYEQEILDNNVDLNRILNKLNALPSGSDMRDKITYGETVEGIAQDVIHLGDTVYVVNGEVFIAPNGSFTTFPLGAKLGFAKNSGEVGNSITVRTIGEVAVDHEFTPEIETQNDLIDEIKTTLLGEMPISGFHNHAEGAVMTIAEASGKSNIMAICYGSGTEEDYQMTDFNNYITIFSCVDGTYMVSVDGNGASENASLMTWDPDTATAQAASGTFYPGNWMYSAW